MKTVNGSILILYQVKMKYVTVLQNILDEFALLAQNLMKTSWQSFLVYKNVSWEFLIKTGTKDFKNTQKPTGGDVC